MLYLCCKLWGLRCSITPHPLYFVHLDLHHSYILTYLYVIMGHFYCHVKSLPQNMLQDRTGHKYAAKLTSHSHKSTAHRFHTIFTDFYYLFPRAKCTLQLKSSTVAPGRVLSALGLVLSFEAGWLAKH